MDHKENNLFAEHQEQLLETATVSGDVITPEELDKFRVANVPTVERVSFETLAATANRLTNGVSTLSSTPALDISTRRPYDAAGLMDFYQPGRWDSTSNSVFMEGIKYGPSPGMWDGTVGYVQFKLPKDGTYLIVANFTGYQITMKMNGPWGTNIGTTSSSSVPGTVTAIYTGKANTTVYFTLTCVYPNLAFLKSVQAYPFF